MIKFNNYDRNDPWLPGLHSTETSQLHAKNNFLILNGFKARFSFKQFIASDI